jgi:hypothetical protein
LNANRIRNDCHLFHRSDVVYANDIRTVRNACCDGGGRSVHAVIHLRSQQSANKSFS